MLRVLKDIVGSKIRGTDAEIGSATDCYFDDARWTIRYLVVDTGNWLPGRRVLISPIAVTAWSAKRRVFDLNLNADQVAKSPDIDTARPISRQKEIEYYRHYGWPFYWLGSGVWGAGATPGSLGVEAPLAALPYDPPAQHDSELTAEDKTMTSEDVHLRSAIEVAGYHIQATDKALGHVEDFLINQGTWVLESVLIDTSNWPGGETVVLPKDRVRQIDWANRKVFVNATSSEVRRQLTTQH